MKTYKETLDFLFSSLPMYQRVGKAAYKANLDNTIALVKALGNPHQKFKSIHIAGTNGKGSVSHALAAILQKAGYKTGLYTSPHLLDFRERIRINGQMIPEQEVIEFVDKIQDTISLLQPSFFEMTVAMAFDYFSKQTVDIAIVETGMGGRLDSTNILNPELCIITNISLDHTEFLGPKLENIAGEKAGIIKEDTPLVLGKNSKEVIDIISQKARDKNAKLFLSSDRYKYRFKANSIQNRALFHFEHRLKGNITVESDLHGDYQWENLATALTAIELLKEKNWSVGEDNVREGLKNITKITGLRGRWEILSANPRVICDTAHNEAGVKAVMEQLINTPCKELHIIWGMVADKDTSKILNLLPRDARYHLCKANIPRSLPVEKLAGYFAEEGLNFTTYSSVPGAYIGAKTMAGSDDCIFIGGSTFVVADLLEHLENR